MQYFSVILNKNNSPQGGTHVKLIISILTVLSGNINAATNIIYDINFSSPTHTVGSTPTTGNSASTISSVNFGQPVVEESFGSLTNQPLVFNPNIHSYEQIELGLGSGFGNYKLSFDMETRNLVNSNYSFSIFFDAPNANTLNFNYAYGYGRVKSWSANVYPQFFGYYSDETLMHVEIEVDPVKKLWIIDIGDIAPAFTGSFLAWSNDIESIRFSLAPNLGDQGIDTNVFVGIDNILVTTESVPEPCAMVLFGFLGLPFLAKFRKLN